MFERRSPRISLVSVPSLVIAKDEDNARELTGGVSGRFLTARWRAVSRLRCDGGMWQCVVHAGRYGYDRRVGTRRLVNKRSNLSRTSQSPLMPKRFYISQFILGISIIMFIIHWKFVPRLLIAAAKINSVISALFSPPPTLSELPFVRQQHDDGQCRLRRRLRPCAAAVVGASRYPR